MQQLERFSKIQRLLEECAVVSKEKFLRELEISRSTLNRDLRDLKEKLHAPIMHDAAAGGYRFNHSQIGPRYQLPGLWFNAGEIHALLTMQQLLQEIQPGLLTPHLKPLRDQLHKLLDRSASKIGDTHKRIRVQAINARRVDDAVFNPVSYALLQRQQLEITYFNRGRNQQETRQLSPQRLLYYRDNWYLEAWCHLRDGLCSFALDVIRSAWVLEQPAKHVADDELDQAGSASYGIFNGEKIEWATLRFSPQRARWVGNERWHAQQRGRFDADGYYVLEVPYSDHRELLMDVMRHMPEVEVLGPDGLRERVRVALRKGLEGFEK